MMKMVKRKLPLILIIIGLSFMLTSAAYAWFAGAVNHPGEAPLPEQLAGNRMVSSIEGEAAIAEMENLHGKEFPLVSGAIGRYGAEGQGTLWVSGAPFKLMATRMVSSMRDKIAQGRSPFTPIGEQKNGKRTIYELEGLGQSHFYFQSGSLLIWLAVDANQAEQALAEVLEFYPSSGGP